jgi:hypothetical protein
MARAGSGGYGDAMHSAADSEMVSAALSVWQAASWGGAGGAAAVLTNLVVRVVQAGYRWPWRDLAYSRSAYAFVGSCSVLLGAVVAAAASAQVSGPWPAFIMGATAPSVIRGILGGAEVTTATAEPGDQATVEDGTDPSPAPLPRQTNGSRPARPDESPAPEKEAERRAP